MHRANKITPNEIVVVSIIFILFSAYCLWIGRSFFGTDFTIFYSAGKIASQHSPELVYDIYFHHKMIEEVSKTEKSALLAWFYSPVFLLLVYPLAFLPFKAALLIWNILTLGLYLLAIHRIYPHKAALFAALAFPGVFFNLLWSQNGFLTAFLLGTGMLFIHKNGYIRHSPQ